MMQRCWCRWQPICGAALVCLLLAMGHPVASADETVHWDGLIEPRQVINVGCPVPGILEQVAVERGETVKTGQLLATLQSNVEKVVVELSRLRANMEAGIHARREELEFARRNQGRLKELKEKNAIPFQEWDQVETKRILAELQLAEALENKKVAEAELRRAVEVVNRMAIKSPLNGVVVEKFRNPGEYVEDQPIVKLAQIDPLYVEVLLPVSMLGKVKVGQKGVVKPQEPLGGDYPAKVIVVDKVVDAASETFGVRLELPNPENKISAGLKCQVVFQQARSL